ncbi:MAG: SpoIIE family protein phosphatase, partial [Flavobacteriales bacterium]|nr:SpoIIE family protein phosphatase [Flavobacteriales bacterium]
NSTLSVEEILTSGGLLTASIAIFSALLIRMRINLTKKEIVSRLKLEESKFEIEEKNKEILDSINYAKRIQFALLPPKNVFKELFPNSFLIYKPKDIVSGDFYYFNEISKDEYIFVCADCTGHGVPGAFMTVIGSSLLNQTIIDKKIHSPSQILQELDKQINFILKQQLSNNETVQDGMDLNIVRVNKEKNEFVVSSAKRPIVYVNNGELQKIAGSKYSLGGMGVGEKVFEEVKIKYTQNDLLYMYSDGYVDQFGGDKGKKFSTKRLMDLILTIKTKNIQQQKVAVEQSINTWMQNHEQVDDILFVGIKL